MLYLSVCLYSQYCLTRFRTCPIVSKNFFFSMITALFLMKGQRTSLQISNNGFSFAVFLKQFFDICDVKLVISWQLTLKFPIIRFVFLAN